MRVPERPDRNAIDARSVSKIFGTGDQKVAALDNVSVAIRENEFFTLLGVDPDRELRTQDGRPVQINQGGRVIRELV